MHELNQEVAAQPDRETQAQIEREEIYRAFRKDESGPADRRRNQELEKLAEQRDNVRTKERALAQQVQSLGTWAENQNRELEAKRKIGFDPVSKLNQDEAAFMGEHQDRINQLRMQRDKLHGDNHQIQTQLARLNSGRSHRSNDAARSLGQALTIDKPPSGFGTRREDKLRVLKPSEKDMLVHSQQRINSLKVQNQMEQEQARQEMKSLDILEREMRASASAFSDTQLSGGEYLGSPPGYAASKYQSTSGIPPRSPPKRSQPPFMLPAASPSYPLNPPRNASNLGQSKPPAPNYVNNLPPKPPKPTAAAPASQANSLVASKLNDLEALLIKQSPNRQDFPQSQYFSQPAPTNPQPYFSQPPPGLPSGLPPMYQHPGMSPAQAPFPGGQPQKPKNPALGKIAEILSQQNEENQKLREALASFAQDLPADNDPLKNLGASGNVFPPDVRSGASNIDPTKSDFGGAGGAAGGDATSLAGGRLSLMQTQEIPFPDEFAFRQNEPRSSDLVQEERALMNLAAQEYDQLRVIQKLPKNSEIYEHKMKQYKELSGMRVEIEKILQEQRLEKIKRGFERKKILDEREFDRRQWLDNQKRAIIDGRMVGMGSMPPEPQYGNNAGYPPQQYGQPSYAQPRSQPNGQPGQNQTPSNRPAQSSLPDGLASSIVQNSALPQGASAAGGPPGDLALANTTGSIEPDDKIDLILRIDALFGVPKETRMVQVVQKTFLKRGDFGEPGGTGNVPAETDNNNPSLNRVLFENAGFLIEGINSKKDMVTIFEVQIPDPNQPAGSIALGWTWLTLFDMYRNLTQGSLALPLYLGTTNSDIAFRGGDKKIKPIPGLVMCLKLGHVDDNNLFAMKANFNTRPQEYNCPPEHKEKFNLDLDPAARAPVRRVIPSAADLMDQDYKCEGIKIRLHYVLAKRQFEKMKVLVTLFKLNGGYISTTKNIAVQLPDGSYAKKQTKGISKNMSFQIQKGQAVGFNPRTGEVGAVDSEADGVKRPMFATPIDNFEIDFRMDFYKLIWEQKLQMPLALVIQVFEGGTPVSFALFDLCNKENGKLNYGFHKLPLAYTPVNYDPKEHNKIADEEIVVSILDIISAQPLLKPDDLGDAGSEERKLQPVNDIEIDLEPSNERSPLNVQDMSLERGSGDQDNRSRVSPISNTIYSEQFIPNDQDFIAQAPLYTEKDYFDIYIDGTRHLPDNATMTLLQVRVVDSSLSNQHDQATCMADLIDSTLRNQIYSFKYELRNKKKLKPTSLLYIKIFTIDKSSRKQSIIGAVNFPLFIDKKTEEPPSSNDAKNVTALIGSYQLPILWGDVKEDTPFTYMKFINKERVPTATILVRIVPAAMNDKGKPLNLADFPNHEDALMKAFVAPPEYKEGVYNNFYINLASEERTIMKLRRRRPNPGLMSVFDELIRLMGKNPANMQLEDKGAFLDKAISLKAKDVPGINLDYHSQYEPHLGFRVSVEAIHNCGEKALMGVLLSVLPTASVYSPERGSAPDDAFKFIRPDLSSGHQHMKFREGDMVIKGFKADPALGLFIDIKKWDFKKEGFDHFGYTCLPILQELDTDADENTHEFYVRSGIFSLPVFAGKVDPSVLIGLREQADGIKYLNGLAKSSSNGVKYLGKISIIVRMVDQQRKLHFHKPIEMEPPSLVHVDDSKKKDLKFDKSRKGTELTSILPAKWAKKVPDLFPLLNDKFKDYFAL